MSYVPDGIADRRRSDGVSHVALEIFLILCEHADQDTGLCFPSPEHISRRLTLRLDHVKEYSRQLDAKGWTTDAEVDGRPAKRLHAGWISRAERRKKKAAAAPQILGNAEPESPQNLGNSSESNTQNSGPSPQTLGSLPQILGNGSQTLGTPYKGINQPSLTSPMNQPSEPAGERARTRDPVGWRVFREVFGKDPPVGAQSELEAEVRDDDEELFRRVCLIFRRNKSQEHLIGNLLDRLQRERKREQEEAERGKARHQHHRASNVARTVDAARTRVGQLTRTRGGTG